MLRKSFVAAAALFILELAQAQAHFVWVDLKSSGQQPQAQIYFGEMPEPGEPRLLSKVSATKAWMRGVDGEPQELKLAPAANKELAALVAPCVQLPAASIEAQTDYGVYARGPGVLLQYYARHLAGNWPQAGEKLARAERLALDVVPTLTGDRLVLEVLYQGKPSVGSEVVLIAPDGEQKEVKTNAEGRVELPATAGRHAIRAAHIERDKSGQRDGQKYAETWHYATLTLDVPATTGPAVSAVDLLEKARAGRSLWGDDFPGFTADLGISGDGQQLTGKLTIDAEGDVSVELSKSPLADWAEEQLHSLVQHRMPRGEVVQDKVTYSDDDTAHPLGRKIDLGDPNLQSAYRIKDDVIMEVNRSMGKQRFTISVLEIERNAENKYLPRAFTMNFFDSASGDLKMSLGYWNSWQRVGKFDLPKSILEVAAHKGTTAAREIDFRDVRLKAKP